MKKFLEGAWNVLKKIWKPVLIALGALFGIGMAAAAVKGLRATFGHVDQPKNWMPVPGDSTRVAVVDAAGKAQTVQLPKDQKGKQMTSDQVAAVGVSTDGQWRVQTKAENVFGGAP